MLADADGPVAPVAPVTPLLPALPSRRRLLLCRSPLWRRLHLWRRFTFAPFSPVTPFSPVPPAVPVAPARLRLRSPPRAVALRSGSSPARRSPRLHHSCRRPGAPVAPVTPVTPLQPGAGRPGCASRRTVLPLPAPALRQLPALLAAAFAPGSLPFADPGRSRPVALGPRLRRFGAPARRLPGPGGRCSCRPRSRFTVGSGPHLSCVCPRGRSRPVTPLEAAPGPPSDVFPPRTTQGCRPRCGLSAGVNTTKPSRDHRDGEQAQLPAATRLPGRDARGRSCAWLVAPSVGGFAALHGFLLPPSHAETASLPQSEPR